MQSNDELKILKQITNQPGCYLFRNKEKIIIYIGKAKNLQKRITDYFRRESHLREEIDSWEVFLTKNEKEALTLERNLIKEFQPRFNILLKDDYYYPYIEITKGNNPSYRLVKKTLHKKNSSYFGPFPSGSKVSETIRLLERIFPLAKCKGNLGKPCLYFMIGQCSGHCFKKIPDEYYLETKKKIFSFFQGKAQEIKRKLKTSIKKNIIDLSFEIAQKQKKILDSIDLFISEQNVEFADYKNRDFLGFYEQEGIMTIVLLIYRFGKLFSINHHTIPLLDVNNKEEILLSYLFQFYQKHLLPEFLYFPKKIYNQEFITEEFDFTLEIPLKGRKRKIINLAEKNAWQIWQNNYWNDFQQQDKESQLKELANLLNIPPPRKIEILDISNLFHQDAVAIFLTFINQKETFNKSKIYRIENNLLSDIMRIEKACLTHYKNLGNQDLPDLLIVDGSREQVKSAKNILQKLALLITVIGLAKNEKHQTEKIITNNLRSINLEKKEKLRNYLANLQDKVHNYALNFHRKMHRKTILK